MAPLVRSRFVRIVVSWLGATAAGTAAIVAVMVLLANTLSDVPKAWSAHTEKPILLSKVATRSVVYNVNGEEMALLFAAEDREEVSLDRVPQLLRDAVLTIEDRDFYQHKGVNLRSGARALFTDLGAGGSAQGGSTITQQLIKNLVTGSQQTLDRKVREAILAVRLEKQMSKDEILERYLNVVYLGHGSYGVQAASETYFNKNVSDIGWPEAALLASLIRNPVGYSPISSPELSRERRALVARLLFENHKIDAAQRQAILDAPLPERLFKRGSTTADAQLVGGNYFSERVKQDLLALPALGSSPEARYDTVFNGGLRVYTTYDPAAQAAAETAVRSVPDTKGKFFTGLAAVDPATGAVRAMVGGPDFATSKYNYVTQGWRQPGSSFKTLVLLAALEAGYVPSDTIAGTSPCRFPNASEKLGYSQIENSGGSGGKVGDLVSQTQSSSNCAYMRLGQTVGLEQAAAMAAKLGITTISDTDGREIPMTEEIPLTLPIGSQEVHPVAMAAAYAAIANGGIYHAPYYIEKVETADGRLLYQHTDPGVYAFSPQTARLATQVLAKNVTGGTGRNAALKKQPAAGKTGTTSKNVDAWFVGFTPYLATAVWIGSPDDQETVKIRGVDMMGGNYPAKVWGAFNEAFHQGREVLQFEKPEPTRKGKFIRYTNKYDRGAPATTVPKKPTTPSRTTGPSGPSGKTTTTVKGSTKTTTKSPATTTKRSGG